MVMVCYKCGRDLKPNVDENYICVKCRNDLNEIYPLAGTQILDSDN